ncbi:MAG: hypothetical protein AMS18_03795 [Gemmatimonas sp. SG8_17]|nr:MAG: hypothetical protein AMS18_03795 [Gemmatimonas sp. SG8_17]
MSSPPQESLRDSIRTVLEQVFTTPEYQWDERRSVVDTLRGWWHSLLGVLEGLRVAHPAVYYVVLGAVVGLLIAITIHAGYIIWKVVRPARAARLGEGPPKMQPHDADWYLNEARRLMRDGSYVEAVAYRFKVLVLRLDARGELTFHPSKTPAEYLLELPQDHVGYGALSQLVGILYRHLFGGVKCTEPDVRHFEEQVGALEAYFASE